jgi:hypothetical protein
MSAQAQIDEALEAVITAARQHRGLLASNTATPDEIWDAYVALNNASVHYDDLISTAYEEVTPWDCEYIEDDQTSSVIAPAQPLPAHASSGVTVSVRHRRDYYIANQEKVIAAANAAREPITGERDVVHLGQAIYALIDAGDGSIVTLDNIDELEPRNGILLINETLQECEPGIADDPEHIFHLGEKDRLLYRLDEVITD